MSGKLSERFAKLQKKPAAGVKAKVTANVVVQKGKRNAKLNANRGIQTPVTKKTPAKKVTTKGKSAATGKGAKVVKGGNAKAKKATPLGKGIKGKKPVKKAPEAPVDHGALDLEIDTYWHKAGKGPDPVLASLDRQIDEYNSQKAANA